MQKQAVIAVPVILTLLGGGWFVVSRATGTPAPHQNDMPRQGDFPGMTTVELINPQPRITTAGWKTCRNEKYEYEFMYPSEWYIATSEKVYENGKPNRTSGNPACESLRIYVLDSDTIDSLKYEINGDGSYFLVQFLPSGTGEIYYTKEMSPEDYFGNWGVQPSGYRVDGQTRYDRRVLYDGKLFDIDGADGSMQGVFETILSTFKFLQA